MEKHELIQALRDLDERLDTPCDIVIVGGAAMILSFGALRATRDVDVLILNGDGLALRKAARRVAEEYGLPED